MTDSDVLVRAAKALREAHTGERQGSGFTRARIMNSVHRDRRRRTLRWAVLSPIASLLVVGSAWAQSSGKWPVIWQAVSSVFVAAPAEHDAPSSTSRPREVTPQRSERAEAPVDGASAPDAAAPAPEPEIAPPAVEPAPIVVPEPRPPAKRRKPRPGPAPASRPERVAPPEPPAPEVAPEPARDRELARFRAAHDLHFAERPREAIRAYAEYLREYPDGRFVPEARYNGALDQIKVGNVSAAREALAPFAAGRYHGYRQKEARELLDALDAKSTTGH